jgi:hypothetical protein
MLIILTPSDIGHYRPRQAHIISSLLYVIFAQQCVAQWTTIMDSSKYAQRCILQFVCAEDVRPADIHSRMTHVYSDNCLQCTVVFYWCKRFREGWSSTEDLAHPGCPPHVMDPNTHAKVDQIVQCDSRVTLWHVPQSRLVPL